MPSKPSQEKTPYPWEVSGERVVLETPEQTSVEYRIAPLGSRFVAVFIDLMLLWLVTMAVWVAVVLGTGFMDADKDSTIALITAGSFLLQLGYFVVAEFAFDGRTYGKRRMNLRTVRDDGRGLTFGASLLRNLARIVDHIPIFWIVPALDRRRRRIGDWVAGTLVVRTDEEGAQEFDFDPKKSATSLDRRDFHIGADAAAQLYLDDLNLLEHVFARLDVSMPRQRKKLLRELAGKYSGRMGLDDQAKEIRANPERFLFEVYLLLKERFEREAH